MKVGICMGSINDWEQLSPAAAVLERFGIQCVTRVTSVHRSPLIVHEFAENAEKNGLEVIIAAAGGAAHLPGMVAALCSLPVIGMPVKSRTMDGLDSLLSIVQMPPGVPVATVTIGGAENAGLLAAQILSVKYPELREKIKAHKALMVTKVITDDKVLQQRIADGK